MTIKDFQLQIGVNPDGDFGPASFNAAAKYLGITSKDRAVHFFAQCEHETGHFGSFTENLNYSADGLRATWPKRFDSATALAYARKPENIANKVYADRMGNGDEDSGDGWLFRGRGALQLTGRFNYQKFSVYVDDHSIMTNPDSVGNKYAFNSAMFFFRENNLWLICDKGTGKEAVTELTKRINGGVNGLSQRIELTIKYSKYRWDG